MCSRLRLELGSLAPLTSWRAWLSCMNSTGRSLNPQNSPAETSPKEKINLPLPLASAIPLISLLSLTPGASQVSLSSTKVVRGPSSAVVCATVSSPSILDLSLPTALPVAMPATRATISSIHGASCSGLQTELEGSSLICRSCADCACLSCGCFKDSDDTLDIDTLDILSWWIKHALLRPTSKPSGLSPLSGVLLDGAPSLIGLIS
mmetsp:Transcript_21277/g.33091  ORF Transcript_21277/g.33091 Transcript_21277/m.33091 type:complete len:206 (-) Transcript_21277:193-810(-)